MEISRRTLLFSAIAATLPYKPAVALARDYTPLSSLPPIPDKYRSLAEEEDMNQEFADQLTPQGTLHPTDAEVGIANDIIAATPTQVPPIGVAGFLLDVAAGKHGSRWQPYTRAWPVDADANPLILTFFTRTNTKPAGDRTAWCAAFVNWCLFQSHGFPYPLQFIAPTGSAAALSFKSWGQTVIVYNPHRSWRT